MNEIEELKVLLKELSKKDPKLLYEAWVECVNQGYLKYFPPISINSFLRDLTIEDYEEFILNKNESIEDRYAKYFRLVFEYSNDSKNFEADGTSNRLKELYKSLLEESLEKYEILFVENENVRLNDRLYIYINQYLPNRNHSPSTVLEKMISLLKSRFKEIYVVSSTPYPYPYPDKSVEFFNYSGLEENTIFKLEENVFFLECRGYLTESSYLDFIKQQKVNKKDKFLLIGHSMVHFDILDSPNKIIIPLGSTFRRMNTGKHLIAEFEDIKVKNIFNNPIEIIKSASDFTKEIDIKFVPKDIKLDKTINIAIVGNRLDQQLTQEFFKSLINVIKNISTVSFKIVGGFTNKQIIPNEILSYIDFVGHKDILVEYFSKEIHFYLNPKRKGGGHSSVLAYKVGVPIITLPYGDVNQSLENRYYIENYDEISVFIKDYIKDKNFKENIDNINRELVESTKEKFDQMVNKILEIDN